METVPPFVCFNINAVENCKIHEINYNIKISTFNCLECLDEYFLIDNFCIPRILIENCLNYELDQDKCKACDTTYYVDEDGKCKESFQVDKSFS